jgi:O-antigen/teichoic acid export membrane protein
VEALTYGPIPVSWSRDPPVSGNYGPRISCSIVGPNFTRIRGRAYCGSRMPPDSVRRRMEKQTDLQKILDSIGWLFFDRILRMGLGLFVGAWVARYLGPDEFGRLNYAIALIGIFGAIASLGLRDIVMRDIVLAPNAASVTLGTAFVLQTASGLIAILLIIPTITLLRPEAEFVRLIVIILSISLIFRSTDIVRYWFESQVQSRYIVWIENGVAVLSGGAKISMILIGASLIAFVWVTLAEAMLVAAGLLWIYVSRTGGLTEWQPTAARAKTLLSDSWPLFLAGLAVMLYMRVDILMLQELAGDKEVGIYVAATKLSEVWYFLPGVIVASVSPSLIKCHQTDMVQYRHRLQRLYFAMWWLAAGIALPLSLFSEQIVQLLYGADFVESAQIFSIHLWASVAVFLGIASSQHLLVEKLQTISFFRTMIGLISNVILNLLLIPAQGAKGAAIATVISYFIATFSLVFFRATRQHSVFLLSALLFKRTCQQRSAP